MISPSKPYVRDHLSKNVQDYHLPQTDLSNTRRKTVSPIMLSPDRRQPHPQFHFIIHKNFQIRV